MNAGTNDDEEFVFPVANLLSNYNSRVQRMFRMMQEVYPNPRIIADYSSSYGQPLATLIAGCQILMDSLSHRPLSFVAETRYVHAVLKGRLESKHVLHDGKGFITSTSRTELAARLSLALMSNARDASWSNRQLILELPLSDVDTSGALDILTRFTWPPDPADSIIQSLQMVLGWQFDIDTSVDRVSFSIDFGDSYYEE